MPSRPIVSTLSLSFVTAFVVSACGGAIGDGVRPQDYTGKNALGGDVLPCGGEPKYAKPLVVDLDGDTRLALEAAMRKGVAVVSYDCKSLRVLNNCKVQAGSYEYAGASKREHVVQLKSKDELSVNLPLSAGKLGSQIESGRAIDLALVSIGMSSTTVEKPRRSELVGTGCEGATHFVQTATIGAFSMATGSVGKAKAVAELFSVGASASSESEKAVATTDGTLEDCRKSDADSATPPKGCHAPISFSLMPVVADVEAAKVAAAEAKAEKKEKSPEPQKSPCREGYVFVEEICTRATSVAHLCDPKNEADCKEQCDKGNVPSCYNYGIKVHASIGRPYLKKACENGIPDACGLYGWSLLNYDHAPTDPENAVAFNLARQGCRDGGGKACAEVGYMTIGYLSRGDEPTKANIAIGVQAYTKGCRLGDQAACRDLGELYLEGKHVRKDVDRALGLLERACVGDEPGACLTLAKAFSSGENGIARDLPRAAIAAGGVCPGLKGIFCDEAVQIAVDANQSALAFRMASETCAIFPYNCGKLGFLYRDGIGTPKNAAKAREAWTTACGEGKINRTACEALKN